MLELDVMTAYVICGVGSLIGVAMLGLAETAQTQTAAALRLCKSALLILGVSLIALVSAGHDLGLVQQTASSAGVLITVLLWAWAVGRLSGHRAPDRQLLTVLPLAALVPIAGATQGVSGLTFALTAGLLVSSVWATYMARRYVLRPPNAAAGVLGGSTLLLAASSLLRFYWTLTTTDPVPPHLLVAPLYAQGVFAAFYGVLPMVIATMLLVMVNSQLRMQLSLRASTDELTGLKTRRALRELATAHVAMAQRSRRQVAALMLDLDHFKVINDQHGHATGDVVLREAARIWTDALRPDSLLARYGGEEFVVLAPVDSIVHGIAVAERLRTAIGNAPWAQLTGTGTLVTTSIGVALMLPNESLDEALKRADQALYGAKHGGRNRVQAAASAGSGSVPALALVA